MEAQLANLSSIIEEYHNTPEPNGESLNEWIKDASALLFFLTSERIKAHKRYNTAMFTRGSESVAGQTIVANEKIPELYHLRHIIKSGYECLGAMRSNLVSRRHEREYSNSQS